MGLILFIEWIFIQSFIKSSLRDSQIKISMKDDDILIFNLPE
ncbi:hypothetical protein PMI13_03116 [Chryseobacterium populi]|uniref:Uncharacterized protein n=1 Tax=Chryseobacterium populi TaxID=1144316 RepID=J3CE43_9FLAO|nr:hypothetical protein PMI13_03116 [Chryseobacterium populi]